MKFKKCPNSFFLAAAVFAAVLVSSIFGCKGIAWEERPVESFRLGSLARTAYSIPKVDAYYDDFSAEERYRKEVMADLEKGEFEELEQEAIRAQTERSTFPSGDWMLYEFFLSFSDLDSETSPTYLEEMNHQFELWTQSYPQSETAWLAWSQFTARRGEIESQYSFSNIEITPDTKIWGWKNYREANDSWKNYALKAFQLDQELGRQNPQIWYQVFLLAASSSGTEGLPGLDQCIAHNLSETAYPYAGYELAWYYGPYSGRTGTFDANAFQSFLDKRGVGAGEDYWFSIASWLQRDEHDDLFNVTKLDFEKLQKSFAYCERRAKSLVNVGRMAHLAYIDHQNDLASQLLQRLGPRFETKIWYPHLGDQGDISRCLGDLKLQVTDWRPEARIVPLPPFSIFQDKSRTPKDYQESAKRCAKYFAQDLSVVSEAFSSYDQLTPAQALVDSLVINMVMSKNFNQVPEIWPILGPVVEQRKNAASNRDYIELLVGEADDYSLSEDPKLVVANREEGEIPQSPGILYIRPKRQLARDLLATLGPKLQEAPELLLRANWDALPILADASANSEEILEKIASLEGGALGTRLQRRILTFVACYLTQRQVLQVGLSDMQRASLRKILEQASSQGPLGLQLVAKNLLGEI